MVSAEGQNVKNPFVGCMVDKPCLLSVESSLLVSYVRIWSGSKRLLHCIFKQRCDVYKKINFINFMVWKITINN